MNNPTSTAGRTTKLMKRRACVLALVLMLLAAVVGGVPSREVGAQESPLTEATDTSTAEVEVEPTDSTATTAATASPGRSTDGWNRDMATVTIQARHKTH